MEQDPTQPERAEEAPDQLYAEFFVPVLPDDELAELPPEIQEVLDERGIEPHITPVEADSLDPALCTHRGIFEGTESIIRILKSKDIEEFSRRVLARMEGEEA